MSIFRIEFRRSLFRWAWLLLAACTVVIGLSRAFPQIATWESTVATAVLPGILVNTLAAVFACWEGLRAVRTRTLANERSAPRGAVEIALPHLCAVLAWSALSFLAGFFALSVRSLAMGVVGEFPIWWLIAGFMCLLLSACLGFVCGSVIHSWLAVPISMFIVYVPHLLSFTSWGDLQWTARLIPILGDPAFTFGTPNTVEYLGQALWFLSAAILLVAIWQLATSPRRFPAFVISLVAMGIGGFGVAHIAFQNGSPIRFESRASELECGGQTVEVCLLPEFHPIRRELMTGLEYVAERVQGTDLAFDQVQQEEFQDWPERGPRRTIAVNPGAESIARTALSAFIAENVVGVSACSEKTGAAFDLDAYLAVASWLNSGRSIYGAEAFPLSGLERLTQLDAQDGRIWVMHNADKILSCSLVTADFP